MRLFIHYYGNCSALPWFPLVFIISIGVRFDDD